MSVRREAGPRRGASVGACALAILCAALWGARSAPAQATPAGDHAAHTVAEEIERASALDEHRKGVAVARTRRDSGRTLTAWYTARPGAYADSGGYILRVVIRGHLVITVSVASYGQLRPYRAGSKPEEPAKLSISFERRTLRGRTEWFLSEHDRSFSCGEHAVPSESAQVCTGVGGARQLPLDTAEATRYQRIATAMIHAARRHAPV